MALAYIICNPKTLPLDWLVADAQQTLQKLALTP